MRKIFFTIYYNKIMHKILIIYIILLLIILAIVIWGGVTNWEFVSRSSPPEYNSLKRNAVLLRGYHYKKKRLYENFASDKPTQIILIQKDSHIQETKSLLIKYLNDDKIDFLFIDGDHSYEGAKQDYEMYAPLVNKNGIIVFHDIVPHSNPTCQVNKFWDEIKNNYRYQEIIEHPKQTSMGIGVLFV